MAARWLRSRSDRDGRSLRKKLIAEHPDYQSRMIFVTGDLLGTAKAGTGIDGCPVVEKPFRSERPQSQEKTNRRASRLPKPDDLCYRRSPRNRQGGNRYRWLPGG